ncbi:unnamed protein product, partial [Iphiclides podalirius]
MAPDSKRTRTRSTHPNITPLKSCVQTVFSEVYSAAVSFESRAQAPGGKRKRCVCSRRHLLGEGYVIAVSVRVIQILAATDNTRTFQGRGVSKGGAPPPLLGASHCLGRRRPTASKGSAHSLERGRPTTSEGGAGSPPYRTVSPPRTNTPVFTRKHPNHFGDN